MNKIPARLSGGDIGVVAVVGTLLALLLVGLPAWAVARGWLPLENPVLRYALVGVGTGLGYWLALCTVAWNKASLNVMPDRLRVRFPYRPWRRGIDVPYRGLRQLRFGPDDHNKYWLMVYRTHAAQDRQDIRIDIPNEDDLPALAHELEALGIKVVVWEEL